MALQSVSLLLCGLDQNGKAGCSATLCGCIHMLRTWTVWWCCLFNTSKHFLGTFNLVVLH
eukprot:12125831-Ditylum_brightwellii.AAC.1